MENRLKNSYKTYLFPLIQFDESHNSYRLIDVGRSSSEEVFIRGRNVGEFAGCRSVGNLWYHVAIGSLINGRKIVNSSVLSN